MAEAKRERLPLTVGKLLGGAHFLYAQRHRIGILIGAFLGMLLLVLGCNVVWRMEITGNDRIPDERIEEELADLGFGVGSFCSAQNYDSLIAVYRSLHPEIAWMGIYTVGTTAYVRVIENERRGGEENQPLPSHLVANADALILETDITHGTAVVQRGSVVKKGDVLVLGVSNGVNYDHVMAASGVVIGRVSERIVVEIPKKIEEKNELYRETVDFSLNFFQKTINIFKKTNKNSSDYVIIKRKEVLHLKEGIILPIGYTVKEAVYYSVEQRERQTEELLREGVSELDAKVRCAVGDGELLSKKIRWEEQDDILVLYATVEYTKNIAERLLISASGGENGG